MSSKRLLHPERQLAYESGPFDRLTHYLFRYPAKFHPPVVKTLISEYSQRGDRLLDPFCGSGSMLVEAAVAGRHAVGLDLDPVAAFVSRVKTHLFDVHQLSASINLLSDQLHPLRRPDQEYLDRSFRDITLEELESTIADEDLWIPAIPNLFHWFRKYVILDMARVHRVISDLQIPPSHKDFLLLCFASIIRASSNADPVPVSGLEVTSHMKRKEAEGRIINPYALLDRSIAKAVPGVTSFSIKADRQITVSVHQGTALQVSTHLRRAFDAIITSPPYHNAVDYYRRHQLEMFWLGFTRTQADRLALKQEYLGRQSVSRNDPILKQQRLLGTLVSDWDSRIRKESDQRANSFLHYCLSMKQVFLQFEPLLRNGSPAVIVIGNSKWNGTEIPTVEILMELARPQFEISSYFWYPVKNRYMSYTRRNGASIDKEHVLVMRHTHASRIGNGNPWS